MSIASFSIAIFLWGSVPAIIINIQLPLPKWQMNQIYKFIQNLMVVLLGSEHRSGNEVSVPNLYGPSNSWVCPARKAANQILDLVRVLVHGWVARLDRRTGS
jgi:hypothetical protein